MCFGQVWIAVPWRPFVLVSSHWEVAQVRGWYWGGALIGGGQSWGFPACTRWQGEWLFCFLFFTESQKELPNVSLSKGPFCFCHLNYFHDSKKPDWFLEDVSALCLQPPGGVVKQFRPVPPTFFTFHSDHYTTNLDSDTRALLLSVVLLY